MTESVPEFYFPRRPDLLAFFPHPSLNPDDRQIYCQWGRRAAGVKISGVPWNPRAYAHAIGEPGAGACFTRFSNPSNDLAG